MDIDLTAIMAMDDLGEEQPEPTREYEYEYNRVCQEPEYEIADITPEPDASERYGQDRRRMILTLQMYLNEFPKKLAKYGAINFEDLSNDELEKVRQEMDYVLGSKQNLNAAVSGMILGVSMLEQVATTFTPLKIQGLSNNLCADPEAIDDMRCVALKHINMLHIEPEARLGMRILKTGLQLHTMNSLMAPPPVAKSQPDVGLMPDKFNIL